jgi:AcrR family transcriptional regulator
MTSTSQKQTPPEKEVSVARQKATIGRRPSTATPGREVLLGAAMDHFARFGYEGTSLRALAAIAEVDTALVARLFGSKAQLWMAVVDLLAEHQEGHLAQLSKTASLSAKNPRLAMHKLIELFAQISYEMPAFPAFLMHECSNPGERMAVLVERLVAPFRVACTPVIAAAMTAGIVRVTNVELFFSMLITAISVPMASPALIAKDGKLTQKLRDEIASEACKMVLA